MWTWATFRERSGMDTNKRIVAIVAVIVLALVVVGYRHSVKASAKGAAEVATASGKPVFIEIGAKSCIPCQMMQKVMAELQTNYPASWI